MELAPQPTVSIRTHAAVQDLPQVLGTSYGALAAYLDEVGEAPMGAPFVAYYTMDMANLDIEIGIPVARPLPGHDTIQASQIPGGPVARCLYEGPYTEIGGAYEALTKWVADQGYETTGVAYEHYLNDPDDTPPAELQTQIVLPLKPAE
jgi:effector-binding domain-containing protein